MSIMIGLVCVLLCVVSSSAQGWTYPMGIANFASGPTVLFLTLNGSGLVLQPSPVSDDSQSFQVSEGWPMGNFTVSCNGLFLDSTNNLAGMLPASGAISQLWNTDYYGQIVSVATGRRLVVPTMANFTAAGNAVYLAASITGLFSQFASWVFVEYSPAPAPFYVSLSSASQEGGGTCYSVADVASDPVLEPCQLDNPNQLIELIGDYPIGFFQLKFVFTNKCLGENNKQVFCNSTGANTQFFTNPRGQISNPRNALAPVVQCLSVNVTGGLVASVPNSCDYTIYTNRWIFRQAPPPPVACFKYTPSNIPTAPYFGSYFKTTSKTPTTVAGVLTCPTDKKTNTNYTIFFGTCYSVCPPGYNTFLTGLTNALAVPTACYTPCIDPAFPIDNGAWCTNNPDWAGESWPVSVGYSGATVISDCFTKKVVTNL